MNTLLQPLKWQAVALGLRTAVDLIILGGGRGGGKTHCSMLGLTAHCAELKQHASPLVVRESWTGLSESLEKATQFSAAAFGTRGLSYNKASGVITLPTGGHIYGASLHEGEASYLRWQGRNLTGIWAEEAGNYNPTHFAYMRRLESNLRPPLGFKAERWWTANPGGKSHHTLLKNWISKAAPWKAGRDHNGLSYVWIPSTYDMNTHIDREQYRRSLTASVGSDHELAEAWLAGTWAAIRGAMFPVDPEVHLIPPVQPAMLRGRAKFVAGSDYGGSSPSTAILFAQTKEPMHLDGRFIPYGAIIAVAETDTCIDPNDLSEGSGQDPRSFAEQIRVMLAPWGADKCKVITDDFRGLKGDTVIQYYCDAGLRAEKPDKKSRVEGWDNMRGLLANTERNLTPQLLITTACPRLFETMCEAPRGDLNPRDLDPKYNRDHHLDGASYGLKELNIKRPALQGKTTGHY